MEGRGDGSFLSTKYTGIQLFVRQSLQPHIRLMRSAGVSLGFTEGSKGGASFLVQIFGVNVVFVCVHLSARTAVERRAGYSALIEGVGNQLGDSYFQLLEQFPHVVFFGDLNYRTVAMDHVQALEAIKKCASPCSLLCSARFCSVVLL